MTPAEIISIIALCVSVASFTVSVCVAVRDRARVRAKCTFIGPCHNVTEGRREPASIFVELINKGRRAVIVKGFVRESGNRSMTWARVGPRETGLDLGENGRYTTKIQATDCDAGNGVFFTDMWFEDSLGNRYPVKGAKRNLKRLVETEGSFTNGIDSHNQQ